MNNHTKTLRPGFLLLVLSLSFFFCLTQIEVARSQNLTNNPITVPMQVTAGGHLVIKATINGVTGNFIFDTGAGLNLLTKKFADKVSGLKKLDGSYTGHRATGEAMDLELWNVKSMKIGDLDYSNQLFSVLDIDFPLDGLISLLPFRETPLTINYKTKSLVFESASSLKRLAKSGKTTALQLADHRGKALDIFANVRVNDLLTLQVGFDSGAGANVYRFNSKFMNALGVDSTKTDISYRKSSFDPKIGNKFYNTKLGKIALADADIKLNEVKVSFIQGLIYDGIMAMNWLGEQLTIDIPGKRLLIN